MSATQQDILDWLPFAKQLARNWKPFKMELEDAQQEAALALVKAAENPKFDPAQSNFGTYGGQAIMHRFQNLYRKASCPKRDGVDVPLYLTNNEGKEWERPEMAVEPQTSKSDIGLRVKVEHAIARLPKRQREVIRMEFGFDGESMNQNEIAAELGGSPQSVSQAHRLGLQKLGVYLSGLAACLCLVSGCATKQKWVGTIDSGQGSFTNLPMSTLVTTPQSFQPMLRLYGQAGWPYRVEGTTNGTEWATVAVLTMPTNMTVDVELLLPYAPTWQFRTVTP